MKKSRKILWIALMVGFSATAFAGSNEGIGTVVGGIAGGLIGSNIGHGSGKTAATIGGAVVGGLVGNQVASSADAEDYHRDHYRDHWQTAHRPIYSSPQYSNIFIGRDGRMCRRSILTDSYGDKMIATYCCYRSTPNGTCLRWVRIN
jgi:uncharacterized protein YcfJ